MKLWDRWCRFWMAADGSRQWAIFRPALCTLLIFFEISRAMDLKIFYTNSGIMPASTLSLIPGWGSHFSLLNYTDSMVWITALHFLLIASLLMLGLGVMPRISAILAFVLHVSFLNRNIAVCYGVDTISSFFLFYLCFADYRVYKPAEPDLRSMLASIAFRFSQIQICVIYGYSGLDKVQGYSWWSGEAVWYIFANNQVSNLNFSWMAHFPLVIVLLTYSTLFWEIYFPALVWVKKARYPLLTFGVLLHLGIGFVMGLKSFGMLMILLYLLFIEDADADKIAQCVKKYATPRKVFLH